MNSDTIEISDTEREIDRLTECKEKDRGQKWFRLKVMDTDSYLFIMMNGVFVTERERDIYI